VFVADCEALDPSNQDLRSQYGSLIRSIFRLLKAQLPALTSLFPKIEAAFRAIVESTTKPETIFLPRKLTQNHGLKTVTDQLLLIGDNLISNWFDSAALLDWISAVTNLPVNLARAFGFTDVIFVLDHFDAFQECISPVYPFEDSPETALLDQSWKYAMQTSSFVLAARDSAACISGFPAIDSLEINVGGNIEYLSLEDAVVGAYSDAAIVINLNGNRNPVALTWSSCAGYPPFVSKWDELNQALDKLAGEAAGSVDYQEHGCAVLAAADQLLGLLFIDEREEVKHDATRFGIENVYRRLTGQ
jgi:hypothetical protein